jgi:hypothetical protein
MNTSKILELLEKATFVGNTTRKKYLSLDKKGYSCPVGLKYSFMPPQKGRNDTQHTYSEPAFDTKNGDTIYHTINDCISKYCKKNNIDFRWNALTINKNFTCKIHKDSFFNKGKSLVFTLGDFTGGRLILYDDEKQEIERIDVKNQPYIWDAYDVYHSTEEFIGTRYCVVAYWI